MRPLHLHQGTPGGSQVFADDTEAGLAKGVLDLVLRMQVGSRGLQQQSERSASELDNQGLPVAACLFEVRCVADQPFAQPARSLKALDVYIRGVQHGPLDQLASGVSRAPGQGRKRGHRCARENSWPRWIDAEMMICPVVLRDAVLGEPPGSASTTALVASLLFLAPDVAAGQVMLQLGSWGVPRTNQDLICGFMKSMFLLTGGKPVARKRSECRAAWGQRWYVIALDTRACRGLEYFSLIGP